ncbi:ZIP family metal transporter [Patescibacteria group bacterium]|nr:ZIP family metal transporter [Patescibacteria group bacterium]MBU0777392.1 ZIP family metal transporter [Patescibacteria group bacterium]MBU0846028.1 ZIP family metal transporter [Patescibacteria group bacterium]MBU0922472.1 ZIP family metal transporter [Patescibacteria group bacterium]MBU1066795.1 ZIP family metal transporter [Patescibacteria group bacterium]
MNPLIAILLLSFVGSVAGLVGGVVFLLKKEWARTLCKYAVPFAAGVLLSVSLLHLLPEAVHLIGEPAYFIVLIALLFSFFFEQYFAHLHHHEGHKHVTIKASAPLVVFGDTIHNFIDGVAIASAYLVDPYFGLVVTLSTFLHETPHEIGDFGVLMSAGWSRGKTFMANLLSATATFPGALLVYFYLRNAHDKIGILLAISAGIFLYLGASDFLPEVGEEEKGVSTWKKLSLLVIGILLMYFLSVISPAH